MEKLFKLKENGTDVRTEVLAGITTFMTMAYILAINPSMLSAAGMDGYSRSDRDLLICLLWHHVHGTVCELSVCACSGHGAECLLCLHSLPWHGL